jgi:hypothetical protein
MRKIAFGVVVAAIVALGTGSTAAAEPTCSDDPIVGPIATHGQHIIRDYVTDGTVSSWPPSGGEVGENAAGGAAGQPSHRGSGLGPGASFCIPQAQSPGPGTS